MKRVSLEELLSLGEGQSLEIKAHPDPEIIGRHVCAFLNSGGGYVLIGLADSGDVLGVPAGSDLHQLEQAIASRLTPTALVTFEEHNLDGKPVWVVEVPRGQDVPYGYGDEVFIRLAEATRRADVATLRDMVMRRQIEPERWERRFSSADPERDLDPDELRAVTRDDIHRAGPLADGARSPLDVLERLGLISYGRLTNGGDVLFALRPATRHPQVRVRAVCYTGDKEDDSYQDLKALEGPLVQVLDHAYAFIQRNTASGSRFDPFQLKREDRPLYPPEAIREGLVNAFAHRDYSDFRGGVAVNVYPRRLEIWSSGPFPDGITPETVAQGHISILRNPDVAHVLYLRGMMEKLARGGVLIRTACASQGLPPPQWQGDTRGVTLTFFAPEVTPEVTPEVGLEVTPEVRALLQAVSGELARRDLQERLGLKDAEHFRKRYLLPAIERGLLEMTLPDKRNSSQQRYRLTDLGRRILASKGSGA